MNLIQSGNCSFLFWINKNNNKNKKVKKIFITKIISKILLRLRTPIFFLNNLINGRINELHYEVLSLSVVLKLLMFILNGLISFQNICRSVTNSFVSSQKRSQKICWSLLRVCVRIRDPEKVRKIWQVREQIYIKWEHSPRKQISCSSEQVSTFVIHLLWHGVA